MLKVHILKEGEVFTPNEDTYNRDISEVLNEVMDVKSRPSDVEGVIHDFEEAIMDRNSEGAYTQLNLLKSLLSKGDPFWIKAEYMLARLER